MAYGIMVSVAPSSAKTGLRKTAAKTIRTPPINTLLYNAVLAALFAVSLSPCPNNLER